MSRRVFKPSLMPSIVTLLMFTVLLSLAAWQISRSQEKQALLIAFKQAPSQSEVTRHDLRENWLDYKYRKIELRGYYDSQYQVLIENQLNVSEYGFMVLTPFHVIGSQQVVLVNRGWIKGGVNSQPEVAVLEDERVIVGLVGTAPAVGIQLGSLDDSASGWPKSVPYIEMDWLSLQMSSPVAPWVVLLDENALDGFYREWQPTLQMGPEKHKGYAFQWFTLGLVLIFLFVVGSLKPAGELIEDNREEEL